MDISRDRSRSFSNKNEVLLIGDQLRVRMNFAHLIKDRKYHFKTYKNCFVGNELVSWLVQSKFCESRISAVQALQILQDHFIIHHVCDDHASKDDMLFYRFRIDDGTFETDMDMKMFSKGQKIYRLLMSKKKGIVRHYQLNTQTFNDAFIGSAFVDWLMAEDHMDTETAIDLGRKLLDYNIIKHVTDDHHFRNDNCLLYQFAFDFDQQFHFQNVYKYSVRTHVRNISDSSINIQDFQRNMSNNSEKSNSSSSESHEDHSTRQLSDPSRRQSDPFTCSVRDKNNTTSSESEDGTDTNESDSSVMSPRSVLLRHATVPELESPETPYIKRTLRISSDSVGYGFVVRGDGPTYVQTIDPTGPAATAGLKVRQYIHSVNGINVLRNNHKEVAKNIMESEQYLSLSVMVHKRDAIFNEVDLL